MIPSPKAIGRLFSFDRDYFGRDYTLREKFGRAYLDCCDLSQLSFAAEPLLALRAGKRWKVAKPQK